MDTTNSENDKRETPAVTKSDGEYLDSDSTTYQKALLLAEVRRSSHFSGPLPPPQVLAAYEKILPGSAERIFLRFEKQSEHRIEIESQVISSNVFSQRLGTVTAGVIGITGVVGGLILTHEGKDLAGLTAFFATLTALTGIFLTGKYMQSQDLKAKRHNLVAKKEDESSNHR